MSGAAEGFFIAGSIPPILAGGAHGLHALRDAFRPRAFAPIDRSVQPVMAGTGIRLRRWFGGDGAEPSVWRVWLGVHMTHGLGIFTFGLLCLLIALQDYALVERIDVLRPMAIAFSAALLAICLRFFFYGPVIVATTSTVCFTLAAVL
ncbi:MAG TPA: hypothetical protein VF549_00855 [Solirubrobacteraceae bacterium]